MKLLIVTNPHFTAASEYHDNGQPTNNTAPILRKRVKGLTLGEAAQYYRKWPNTRVIIKDV